MFFARLVFLSIATFSLVACNPSEQIEKSLTEPEKQLARETVDTLATGSREDIIALFEEDLSQQMDEVWYRELQTYLPGRTVDGFRPYSSNWTTSGPIPGIGKGKKIRESVTAYEWRSGDRFASLTLKMRTPEGEQPSLLFFNVNHLPGPVDDMTAPDFSLASGGHYLFIGLMVLAVSTTFFGIWRIWRSGNFGRRWLWTLGALFGVGAVHMVWETGELGFTLLNIQLLSAAYLRAGPYAPWMFTVSFPVVALIAIARSYYPVADD